MSGIGDEIPALKAKIERFLTAPPFSSEDPTQHRAAVNFATVQDMYQAGSRVDSDTAARSIQYLFEYIACWMNGWPDFARADAMEFEPGKAFGRLFALHAFNGRQGGFELLFLAGFLKNGNVFSAITSGADSPIECYAEHETPGENLKAFHIQILKRLADPNVAWAFSGPFKELLDLKPEDIQHPQPPQPTAARLHGGGSPPSRR